MGIDYSFLMEKRIKKILMICSSYDAYSLEEDGQIESKIYKEYIDLNISNPPTFTWVTTSEEAEQLIQVDDSYNLIISMFNSNDLEVFDLSRKLKKKAIDIPVVLLTNFSKEVFKRIEDLNHSGIDYIFSWHGNAELILAIIKLIEDSMNADRDILDSGVQAIILVEDSIRYYSTYLPAIYKLVLQQSAEFLNEMLNEQQQKLSKRARPKILLATNYEDAINLYNKYKQNLMGIISDIGFVMKKDDPVTEENLEAGLQLAKIIKQEDPQMPILLQSSQESLREKALEIGCGFILKYSITLLMELGEYISEEFAFGDLVFRDQQTKEIQARAKDLRGLQSALHEVSLDTFSYYGSRNRISKWLYSRGLFSIASDVKKMNLEDCDSYAEVREKLIDRIKNYRMIMGQGVVAAYHKDTYNRYIWFSKMGEGSLGGKARGLSFVNKLLLKYDMFAKYKGVRITIPRSIVVATDFFDEFIKINGLQYVINSCPSDEEVLSEFVSSKLPDRLSAKLRSYLETVRKPLAVRSSSKLEDSNFQPFAGVYSTYMVPVTQNKDQMLRILEKAIKSVYASVFFASSRSYIHTTSNLLGEEKMAVLIQTICGTEDQGYFFPTYSGVARSVNYYPIGMEKPEDGVVNIAFGLGKYIVDGGSGLKFSPKYPKNVLQTSTTKLALRDTQECMYALDLAPDQFKTSLDDSINIKRFTIRQSEQFKNINFVASSWDMYNDRIVHNTLNPKHRKLITFAKILQFESMPLPQVIADIMDICKKEFRCQVEVEFAVNMDRPSGKDIVFNVLQVRPITDYDTNHKTVDWKKINKDNALILTDNAIGPGTIENIKNIIYVKSADFDKLKTDEIAIEVDKMNATMEANNEEYLLVGPGRWGSSNRWLGVPIMWNNISKARVIVEFGLKDYPVEPSQGTHFFQNITSLGVGYITINPQMNEGMFKEDELNSMPVVSETKYLKHIRLDSDLMIYINGKDGKGIVSL